MYRHAVVITPVARWVLIASTIRLRVEIVPVSPLLTEDEAISYLRLDTINIGDPAGTLRRYREQGLLKGTQVSKRVFYLREELDAFLR